MRGRDIRLCDGKGHTLGVCPFRPFVACPFRPFVVPSLSLRCFTKAST